MQIPVEKEIGGVSCPEVEIEGDLLGQLTVVDTVKGNAKESQKAELKLNENAVKSKVDTGADVTVIQPNVYNSRVPKPSLSKCIKTLMVPGKHKLCCLGNSVWMRKLLENSSMLSKILRDPYWEGVRQNNFTGALLWWRRRREKAK